MEYSVTMWKAVVWGLVILCINMAIGNLLYMNPVVAGMFKAFEGNPTMKTTADFGGIGPYVGLNMLAGVFVVTVYLVLYLCVYPVLPGNWIAKGLVFGALIVLVKAVPEAFNQFMLFRYPIRLILVQLVNSTIATVAFGVYASGIYHWTGTLIEG